MHDTFEENSSEFKEEQELWLQKERLLPGSGLEKAVDARGILIADRSRPVPRSKLRQRQRDELWGQILTENDTCRIYDIIHLLLSREGAREGCEPPSCQC